MRIKINKDLNLTWYVLYWNSSLNKVETFNIFTPSIIKEMEKDFNLSSFNFNSEELKIYLKHEFMYHYWSKSEFEFFITDLHSQEYNEKIDIWRQIEPNLDKIVNYVGNEIIKYNRM